ncbi:hypothetical protein ALC53_11323 [Atta colombica]|uniref:Ig-like domain-containing protein n=1 Tax=Atta colombica TaxID=520822 RepID=A0A151HZF2_9HYME|nr:hypothetical protein ALC53_11323 [Atta colombica]
MTAPQECARSSQCDIKSERLTVTRRILSMKEARARILGQADIYVKTGSLLTLTCVMSQGPHDLGTVAWYRGSQAVVTSSRSENDIEMEPRITVETEWSDALTSKLRITHVKLSDSGNYSCVPTVAEGASVNVHVINGKSIRNTITDPHDKIIRVHASITYPTILGLLQYTRSLFIPVH